MNNWKKLAIGVVVVIVGLWAIGTLFPEKSVEELIKDPAFVAELQDAFVEGYLEDPGYCRLGCEAEARCVWGKVKPSILHDAVLIDRMSDAEVDAWTVRWFNNNIDRLSVCW